MEREVYMGDLRVVLTDGHELVRQGIASLLEEENIEVVANGDTSSDAVRYCNGHRPDVLVIDPDSSGCSNQLFGAIRDASPNTGIVVLSANDNPRVAHETFRCGVDGYVLKGQSAEDLLTAVRKAADGDSYLSPSMAIQIAKMEEEDSGLTEREEEILQLIAYGHTNSEIAGELFLSIRTVESHRAHIIEKTNSENRSDLVKFAIEHDMMNLNNSESEV